MGGKQEGRGGGRGTRSWHPGRSLLQPARACLSFPFLPSLFCLSIGPHAQGGSCPPRRCNIARVGRQCFVWFPLKVWACGTMLSGSSAFRLVGEIHGRNPRGDERHHIEHLAT